MNRNRARKNRQKKVCRRNRKIYKKLKELLLRFLWDVAIGIIVNIIVLYLIL